MKRWMKAWMAGVVAAMVASGAGAWPNLGNKESQAWAEGRDARVESELLGKIGYNAETRELRVQMAHSSDWYVYKGVPPEVAEGLWKSKSKGGFFGAHVKGRYAFERIEE